MPCAVLGLRSAMTVPLSVRGKAIGAITFATAETGRRYADADLALAEDLIHRAAMAIENAQLVEEVREADRRKNEFLAVLGHELRNPLAPITTALNLLALPDLSPDAIGQAREIMARQVRHMVRLVDDLLDISRIVRGKVELRREPVELAAVVRQAVESLAPIIEAERHELTVALPSEPLWVDGDEVRLVQVVANILNNAARYTDSGGSLQVALERHGTTAVVRVRDSGIGIAADMLPRVWDMFVQADGHQHSDRGGMGIGLALVKGLVELHGGTVTVHSDGVGCGSEFAVTLPLLPATDDTPRPAALDRAPQASGSRRILVVDDNVDAAESLAMLLELGGHRVRVAHDGLSALAVAEAEPPDVAFLDIGMPGMDGYELARRFRAHSGLRDVMLVALTGWGQEDDRRRTKEAGFDLHEVKPVAYETLLALLRAAPEQAGGS